LLAEKAVDYIEDGMIVGLATVLRLINIQRLLAGTGKGGLHQSGSQFQNSKRPGFRHT